MKRLFTIVTLCILTLAASSLFQSVQADMVKVPTLNMRAVSGDSDIDNASTYVMAVNFWNQNSGTVYNVNGVPFTTVTTNTYTANGVTLTYGSNSSGNILYHAGNSSNVGSGQLAEVMKGMIFNDGQAVNGTVEMSFTGLTAGKDYTYTVYGRVWGASDNRKHSYTFQSGGAGSGADAFVETFDPNKTLYTGYMMSEDNPTIYWPNLNAGTPYLLEYTFTAPADGTFKVTDRGINSGNSWHLYGVSLKEATLNPTDIPVSTEIVKNGGFEKDTFVSGGDTHGYVEKHTAITDWNHAFNASIGMAPEWSDYNKTSQRCGDFINSDQVTKYLPDGSTQALFIQNAGSISQEITLEPDTEYVLSYYTSSRASYRNPYYQATVDGQTVYDAPLRVNQFDKNIFTYNEIRFTSQSGDSPYTTTLGFNGVLYSDADGGTDRTLLLDNVQIVKASEYVAPTITGTKHDPTVNGWQANRWNSQATAYLDGNASDYTHAISLGDAPSTTRSMTTATGETLDFHGVRASGTNNGNTPISQQYLTGGVSVVGSGNHNGGFDNKSLYTDDNSRNLAEWTTCSMDRITLNGLEPGATYETMVYFRSYGGSTRTGYMTINGETSPLINVVNMANGNGGGLLVSYTGTADDSGVINIQFDNRNTDTFHLSAVANRLVSAATTEYNIPLQIRFNGTAGADIVGSKPEVALGQLATKSLVERGFDQVSTFDQYDAKLNYNNGAAIDFNFTGDKATATAEQIAGTNYGVSKITLSADLMPGTLTTENNYNYARGVGFGFFDSQVGRVGLEVATGFAGLVLDPNGNLYYIDRTSVQSSENIQLVAWGTDKTNGGGTWKADAWTNVSMDLELFDDGQKAKITGVRVVGSSADYSSLIGKVFNTTDMIGFTSSSSSTGKYSYVDNVQLIVRETATPEMWNQMYEQHKADYLAAADPNLAAATEFRGVDGTVIPGTALDIIDTTPNNVWRNRGMGNGNWNPNGSRSGDPRFTIIDNRAKTGANTGIAADWDKAEVNSMTLSVDLLLGSLSASDSNYNNARGLGMGFYDADFGTDNGEVGRGFSGIVISPSGGMYYYDYTENGLTRTNPIAYAGGTFNPNDWYTLTMNLDFFQEDGKLMATLTDVSLSGSTADYSDLIGRVFSSTDLIGLLSSSAESWNYYGMFDNFSMSKTVPEPSTWALLILGAAGLLYWRKRK
ncbi:MAG: PEP-CTERM sorting domain-containing protein [Thermoguttaceae bacterium]|nr:PEP-CTERM sorting domain-containing protein [Thermoguttaceae bacterium]